ncbi:MAG: DUF4274 domain-containing protein [Vallitalea sp.]|jgi:hypothetical protein|nr:DUF4274 domain-containing protein [Vallitalea sp.]
MIYIKDMDSKQLDCMLDLYNWDNGFRIPEQIISNPNCEMVTALKAFYLADGYRLLTRELNLNSDNKQWIEFISMLYKKICDNDFRNSEILFKVPLIKIQIHKLREHYNVPNIFLQSYKSAIFRI